LNKHYHLVLDIILRIWLTEAFSVVIETLLHASDLMLIGCALQSSYFRLVQEFVLLAYYCYLTPR